MKKLKRLLRTPPLFLAFCYLLSSTYCFSQDPDWLWAKSAGGSGWDIVNSCTTDNEGNIIVTGNFESPSITFGITTLTNVGVGDIFIVKYDPLGNVLWAKSAGGNSNDVGNSCTTDAEGNIIVTGIFYSSNITFGATTLINNFSGYSDIFIVKYDSIGNVLWAKSAGGIYHDYGNSCTIDANSNIIITGESSNSTITFGTTTLTNATGIFVAKYDPAGNVLWVKSAGSGFDSGIICITDTSKNIIVMGNFVNSIINFGTTTLANANNDFTYDIFIVKYSAIGNVLWAKSAGGTANDNGKSCATDDVGNIIVIGSFNSSTITFGMTTLTKEGVNDIFIVKYDPNGNVLWAKSEGGTFSGSGNSCATDDAGNIIVTGSFVNPTITLGANTLTNAGSSDIFVVKYDPLGNALWAKSAGGIVGDQGSSCTTDAVGNIIVTGRFQSPTITFGTSPIVNADSSGIFSDIFVSKLNDYNCLDSFYTQNISICDGQTRTVGSNIYSSGGIYTDTLILSGGCDSIVTTNLTVFPLPTVSLDTISNYININTSSLSLVGNPPGGTFTGPGVSGNNFEPSVAGLGKKEITYSYTDTNSCNNSATISTIVYDTTGVLCTSYDTVTTTLTINDTVITNITDTTFISVTDTNFVTVTDTNIVTVNDTVFTNVTDTTYISVTDTNFVTITDTNLVTVNDTVFTNVTDTTFISVTDTNFVTVTDTNIITVNDTIFISVTDTIYLTVNDTSYTYISVTDTLIINAILTGVTPPNNTNILKIYPNPTNTHLIIDNGNFNSMSNYQIKIENTVGQKVFESLITQPQFTLDLSSWSGKGIYFLYIFDGTQNMITVRKIVLQ